MAKYILIKEWDDDYGNMASSDLSQCIGQAYKIEQEDSLDYKLRAEGIGGWWYQKKCCVEITEDQFYNENLRNFWYECYRIRD